MQEKNRVLIIKSIRWKESSKIVTLFARESGKLNVIAKGALRKGSTFAGSLESLNLLDVSISSKKSRSLQILTECDVVLNFNGLRKQIDRLPYALAILELIDQTIDEQHADAIFFDFTVTILQALDEASSPEIVFWYFLLKLSSFLGFRPVFDKCSSCSKSTQNEEVYFSLENGGVFCTDCAGDRYNSREFNPNQISFIRTLQKYPHRKIGQINFPVPAMLNFTDLMMQYLNYHLDHAVKLNSLSLLP